MFEIENDNGNVDGGATGDVYYDDDVGAISEGEASPVSHVKSKWRIGKAYFQSLKSGRCKSFKKWHMVPNSYSVNCA